MVISRCVIHQPRVYLAYGSEDVSLSSLGSLASLAPHSRSQRALHRSAMMIDVTRPPRYLRVVAFAFVKLPYEVFLISPRALRTISKVLHRT